MTLPRCGSASCARMRPAGRQSHPFDTYTEVCVFFCTAPRPLRMFDVTEDLNVVVAERVPCFPFTPRMF